jgi:hypothetical protein
VVVARTPAGARIIAMTPPDDTAVVGEMIATDPLGRRAILAPGEGGKVLVSGFAG